MINNGGLPILTDIKDNDVLIWHSYEQKYQHDKCVEFKDDETAG